MKGKDENALYLDASQSVKDRVANLLARMTLDEKIAQLGAVEPFENLAFSEKRTRAHMKDGIGQIALPAGASTLKPIEIAELNNKLQKFLIENTRLGIPAMVHEECCMGFMARGATIFPQMLGAASTWEPELVEEMMRNVRAQMRSVGAHQGLSPVLDIARDPRWGRTEETFGEDPYLASRMGVAYIRGLQGTDLKHGIVATCKHFVGYAMSEGGLNWAPVHLGQRELHEVFLVPFEAAVKEANVASVMNAYHELDGIPCGGSKELLTGILRHKWGFDGIVVSDYHTVPMLEQYHHVARDKSEAAVLALEAGIDIELPATDCYGESLRKAVERGLISEDVLNQAVNRVLKTKFDLGLFENPLVDPSKVTQVFDTAAQRSLAREIAQKSIVLLKNEDGMLPLKKDVSSIAVIGPSADDIRNMVGDYSHPAHITLSLGLYDESVTPDIPIETNIGPGNVSVQMISILEAIKRKTSPTTAIHYAKGCDVMGDSRDGFAEAIEAARKSDVAIIVVGGKSGLTLDCTSGEFRDRADIGLPGVQDDLVRAVCATGKPVVVVLVNGRPLSVPRVTENVPAIVEAWLPGEEGAQAIADVLFGDCNPGGKLPITVPRSVGQIPAFYNHKPSGANSVIYGDYVDLVSRPLFPFGHGLSYTRFEYDNLRVEPAKADAKGTVKASIDVKNVGEREGDEVVQLYVHDVKASVTRPVKELKGFKRITLAPGEKKTVMFTLFVTQLGFYNRDMQFVVEPGTIEVMLGSSSDDIRATGEFEIVGEMSEIGDSKVFFSEARVS
ncbi:MAG: beta-glucosidase [Candidatus Abyssobacteria bacterium SURF_17]|uniref:Beta-glucosidase n=1 Tax=Candidatus Abyssobacteria bacterium SURF_17 TaxID=2093361 RepID=A0A419EX95_9BACT|nr:MAG: beta-glucosidase [Candidatus Abyssubacteria bacterium SURF_17]